jgi:hypothetical protein
MARIHSDTLKLLIVESPLLSADERREWLDLLPSMNEKQLQELWDILQFKPSTPMEAQASSPVTTETRVARKVELTLPKTPTTFLPRAGKSASLQHASALHIGPTPQPVSLKHIANLPMPRLRPKTAGPASGARVFHDRLEQILHEPELMSGTSKPPLAPPVQKRVDMAKSVPASSSRPMANTPVAAQPVPTPRPVPHPLSAVAPVRLPTSLDDAANMQSSVLRGLQVNELITALQSLVRKFGYYDVRLAIEQSPLYQLYMYMGHRMLEQNLTFGELELHMQSDNKDYLTKPEFERATDLLQHLQVNR